MSDIKSLDDLVNFLQEKDNSESVKYFSSIPQICRDEPCILGVDEAGRGPVLGPMVYGTTFCPISKTDELEDLKCADSKTLTEDERNKLLGKILNSSNIIGWSVDLISPKVICNNMYRRSKVTLNEVAMNSTMCLIQHAIDAGVKIQQVYVDTVGPPAKYQEKLTERFKVANIKFQVEKKADARFPIVSAASICAKVCRDHALKVWQFREDFSATQEDFGSGYPNDPLTKKFLKANIDPIFGFPQLVRFSWSTAEVLLKEFAVDVEWSDNEDDEPSKSKKKKKETANKKDKGSMKITNFFTKVSEPKTVEIKPTYFTDRFLTAAHKIM